MNARIDGPGTKRSQFKGRPSRDLPSDQVAAIAYHLYLEDGREDGRDQEHWFRAEQILQEFLAQTADDAREETDPIGVLSYSKGRDSGRDHSPHQTTGRENLRRGQAAPAARPSLRPSK